MITASLFSDKRAVKINPNARSKPKDTEQSTSAPPSSYNRTQSSQSKQSRARNSKLNGSEGTSSLDLPLKSSGQKRTAISDQDNLGNAKNSQGAPDEEDPVEEKPSEARLYDESKVLALIGRYQTLNQDDDDDASEQSFPPTEAMHEIYSNGLTYRHGKETSSLMNRVESLIRRKLFQINFILLSQRSVTVLIYHVVLLIEFLQQAFYIFEGLEVINEFVDHQDSASGEVNSASSENLGLLDQTNSLLQTAAPQRKLFISDSLKYFILHLDVGNSAPAFITVYTGLCLGFLTLTLLLLIFHRPLYESVRTDLIKDGSKLFLKGLTITTLLYLSVLQLPFSSYLFEGYSCIDETTENADTLVCNDIRHSVLKVVSSVFLIFYYSFLMIELRLVISTNVDGELPWSGFDRYLFQISLLVKLVLAANFALTPSDTTLSIVHFCCGVVQAYILFHRCTDAVTFNEGIHWAQITQDTLLVSLFASLSLLRISGTSLNATILLFIAATSLVISSLLILWQRASKARLIIQQEEKKIGERGVSHVEIYLTFLYFEIMKAEKTNFIKIDGIFSNHLEVCLKKDCHAIKMAKDMEGLKQWGKEREAAKTEFQTQKTQDMSQHSIIKSGRLGKMPQDISVDMSLIKQPSTKLSSRQQLRRHSKSGMAIDSNSPFKITIDVSMQEENPGDLESMHSMRFRNIEEDQSQSAIIQSRKDSNQRQEFSIHEFDAEYLRRKYFKFLANQVINHIGKFPKSISLRLLSSYIQRNRTNNFFKSIFDLMHCELLNPNLHEKFVIFRGKLEIQKMIAIQLQRNKQKVDCINSEVLHQYEKLFQRYQFDELLATHYAIKFWRELLSKHVDSSLVQLRGSEINRHYSRIQQTAEKLKTLAPTDVKFLYRYGQFLINIMNNEYEGIDKFSEAQQNYSNRVLARKNNGSVHTAEKELFGENSAAAIFLVESDSNALGKIIHANEEVEYQLGFIPNDIIGQNINLIMPDLIAGNHHKYLTKYLNTGKQKIVERLQQLFPVTKQRYAKVMRALIKIYTQLNGRIIFIGMMQRLKECTLFEEPKQEFQRLPQNLILTDSEGFIMNVSEGLYFELGLHSMLFNYQHSSVSTMINLEQICTGIKDEDNETSLMKDGGCVLSFDTRQVLDNADIEKLDKKEVTELRKYICQRQAFIQMIQQDLGYDKNRLCIYRIILLGQNRFITNQDDDGGDSDTQDEDPQSNDCLKRDYTRMTQGGTKIQPSHLAHSQSSSSQNNGSVSSTMSDSLSSSNGMRNFKQALQGRKVPKNIRILNRFIIIALIILISLTSIEYSLLDAGVDSLNGENHHNLMSEKRTLLTALISSHLKSYFNIAQKVEFDSFQLEELNRFEARFEYIGRLIQSQTEALQEAHEFCTQQRTDDDAGTNILQSQFEYQPVPLFRIDQANAVSTYQLPFRVALFAWLNEIIQLTDEMPEEEVALPDNLYSYEPGLTVEIKFEETTPLQKLAYFLAQNGLRTLRKRTREATQFQQESSFNNLGSDPSLIILVAGLALCLISVCWMLYQMRKIEQIQSDILTLYAFLKEEHITAAFDQCHDYMKLLTDNTFVRRVLGEVKLVEMTMKEVTQADPEGFKQIMRSQRNSILYGIGNLIQGKVEETKELAPQPKALAHVLLRKFSSNMGVKQETQKVVEKTFIQKKHGKLYEGIIKKTYQDMKVINEKMRLIQMQAQQQNQVKRIQLAEERGEEEISKQYQHIKGEGKRSIKKKFGLKKTKKSQEKYGQAKSDDNDVSLANASMEHLASNNASAIIDNEPSLISEHSSKKDARRQMKAQRKEANRRLSIQLTAEQKQLQSYQDRKNQFEKTLKKSTLGRKFGAVAICVIIFAYFLQAYLFRSYFEAQLHELIKVIPIFFNRARLVSLSYSLMRERIIFNNSLRTFEAMPGYGFNLDYYYLDEAMINERTLSNMKLQAPQITQSLVSLLEQIDSPDFCTEVIGETKSKGVTDISNSKSSQLTSNDFKSYQTEVSTIVAACRAAYNGDVSKLTHLYSIGANLSVGDWDQRSPLQYAVRGGQYKAVEYLLTVGANPNIPDRWGSKPLDFSNSRQDISQLLKQNKATEGVAVVFVTEPIPFNLTENDERLFYAALNNDLKTAEIMFLLGWHVNELDIDGRTPVHVAAAEGHDDIVKFLAAKGADLSFFDFRGRCSMDEAEENGFIPLHIWIDSVISDNLIKQNCDTFGQGLLKQGISSAIGTFQRKFSDIQILINITNNYKDRLNILRGPQFQNGIETSDPALRGQYDILQIFWNYQELYVNRIVQIIESTILNSFTDYGDSYHTSIMILFVCFLAFELVALFVFRDWMMQRMREDIFESRGILNLIPNHAIESNKQAVEEIVKKLKN